MYFWEELIILCIMVIIPVLPAWIMYKQFGGQNFSRYQGLNRSVQLGGPIAAYFIIMITIFSFEYNTNMELVNTMRDCNKIQQEYVGNWVAVSMHKDETGEVLVTNGKVFIRWENSKLIINGTYGSDGEDIGSWSADELIANEEKLIFIWQVATLDETVGYVTGVGILMVTKKKKKKVVELRGNWGVIGAPVSGGMVLVRE
jgi:hypothetical protein